MENLFENARENRRATEFTLTSYSTNVGHYGFGFGFPPSRARKQEIWPPLSSEIAIYLEREIPNTGRELDQNNDLLPTNLTTFYVQPNHERLYEPLREGSVVRLLGLEPGKFEDQLRLHFYHVDLAIFCPEYEALSYVWGGSGSGVSSINLAYVSGHQLVISENLNGALRGLRSELKLRIVWVDAICINQNDVGERGHQVSLMSTIYGQARCVVVWLGEPEYGRSRSLSDRGERMFTTVCHIVNDWLGKNHQGRTATFDVVSNSGGRRTVQPPSTGWCYNSDKGSDASIRWSPRFWEAISGLFNCTWFWRLWVFQEIVLARSATMKFGHAEIDWRWVGLAAAILRTKHHTICESKRIGGAYNAYLMFRISRQSDLEPIKLDFLRLLRLTRQFGVTDARDRVYGLLGITTTDHDPKSNVLVSPNYDISTYELWRRIATRLLMKNGDLSVLSCVQYCTDELESETRGRGLHGYRQSYDSEAPASWVPQWNRVYQATLSPWDSTERFSASKGLPKTCVEPISSDRLFLQGIRVGTIVHCCRDMLEGADFSLLQSDYLKEFFTSEAGLKLLARTMTAGRDSYGSIRQNEQDVADVAAFILSWGCNRHSGLLEVNPDPTYYPTFDGSRMGARDIPGILHHIREFARGGVAERFGNTARRFCQHRRLFLTTNGHLGLGPDIVQEGDVLCVLNSGDMPFILRPCDPRKQTRSSTSQEVAESSYDTNGRHYLLVGECYVEGMMTGDAVKHLGKPFPGPVPSDLIHKTVLDKSSFSQIHNQRRNARNHQIEIEDDAGDSWDDLTATAREPLQKSWFSIL